jgi:DNA (cytosine-5)-methyltransferase 1
MAKKKYTFIDLFAGCGGLSEGFLRTGRFNALAHVEWEKPMVETLRNRLVTKWNESEENAKKKVILFDIQKTEELINGNWSDESIAQYGEHNSGKVRKSGLKGVIGNKLVDLIIGGPPCQAYSIHGRATDKDSMNNDYRNYLFESFVKIVDHFKPKAFVFENVPGLLSACPGDKPVTIRIYEAFKAIGYTIRTPENLKNAVYCAEDYETPQKRNRIIIIGVKEGAEINLEDMYDALTARKKTKHTTVRDAIGNMPKFRPLEEPIKGGKGQISHELISESNPYSLHIPRFNNKRDIETFRLWLTNNMNKWSQKDKLEYYTKVSGKKSNHVKYRSLEWDKPSPTIVAHLHKDGLMFIHPDVEQLRSITIREAACLQSFPLDYEFIASTPYCYKMIGNAVPVQFAKNIALAVCDVLDKK